MNRRVWLGVVAGVVGVAACGGQVERDFDGRATEETTGTDAGTGGSGGGSSGPGAGAVNFDYDEDNQVPLEARRYDPTRQCYWESARIDGLYAVEQSDPPNMGWGSVCVISDTGDVYVALLGTSQAVVKTDSTAAWKVPTWTGEWLTYYDYSAFTPEEDALCRTAMDGIAPAGADSGSVTTCTDGGGGAGGSSGSTSTAGAAGGGPIAPPGCEGVIMFADPALERAVRQAIVMRTGDIRFEHVSQLSRLDANGQGVVDLIGLECLQGLTTLSLLANDISDVTPLSGLTSLTWLSLSENNISDVTPLVGLTMLGRLDIYDNRISDLTPLSGLTSLWMLDLRNNNVSDLSPLVANAGLDHGDDLDITSNPIDCAEQADNILALRDDRGVHVTTDCIFTAE